jgi:O-succinylbenzoate synthase
MKLQMRLVTMPMVTPFETSFGRETHRNALIFNLEHDGISAYSECVTDRDPHYSYEDNTTASHIISDYLASRVKGLPEPSEFIESVVDVKGHNMAKAAMEMLLWDYHSRAGNIPLHRALGKSRGYAMVGVSIGMDSVENVAKRAADAKNSGYMRVKIKIKKGRERELVSRVRSAIGDFPMSVDANTDYRISDLETLKSLDEFGLVYMEQPLEHTDIVDHAYLAKNIRTPVCLDESILSEEDARKAIDIGACKVINIKPGRVGGLTESVRIAKKAREKGCHVWVGGMLETGIGRAFNVAMASNGLIDYPGDTSPNSRYFNRDIVRNPFKMEGGKIKPNDNPGTGVDVDREELEKVTVWKKDLL